MTPPKPTLELWQVPVHISGQFVAQVSATLSIGTGGVADGRSVKGFGIHNQT